MKLCIFLKPGIKSGLFSRLFIIIIIIIIIIIAVTFRHIYDNNELTKMDSGGK